MISPHHQYLPIKIRLSNVLTCLLAVSWVRLSIGQSAGSSQQFPSTRSDDVEYMESKMSATDRHRINEQGQILQFYNLNVSDMYSQFAFEITNEYEQFHFHLATDHVVHFIPHIYVLKNNAYIQIPNIDVEPAMHVVVYENNHRIVAEKSFYFQNAITIEGKGGSTYMMRFFSPTHKLVTISHNSLVQLSHFEDKVKNTDMEEKALRIASINNKLHEVFKNLRFSSLLEVEDRKLLVSKADSFIIYQMVEIVLLVVVCLLQIKIVSKLFKTQSII